jgi:RecA/RadA recombinase
MGRKKAVLEQDSASENESENNGYDQDKVIERIEKEISASFGKNLLIRGTDIIERPKQIIPVSPRIDSILGGGVPEGSWFVLTGKPKCGKAQSLDSVVYTPNGPVKMRDIKKRDLVLGQNGKATKVTGVYPQGKKDIYKVYFQGGDIVECCKEHLWEVKTRFDKNYRVLELQEIMSSLYEYGNRPKWSLKLTKVVHFNKKDVLIDPYLLGVLIGDGSFRSRSLRFTGIDHYIINNIRDVLDDNYELRQRENNIEYIIKRKTNVAHKYIEGIKHYGLWGKLSKEKFIPLDYKYNSYETRLAILQGLMDTDGFISKRGSSKFYTLSEQLAKDVKEIVNSIGGLCSIKNKVTTCNDKTFHSFVCNIRVNDNSVLFKTPIKKERSIIRKKKSLKRLIQKIEYKGSEEAQCISVKNDNGLYLTDNFVVTHNSVTSLHFAGNAQKPEYGSRNVYYINVEGRLKKRDILGMAHLNPDKLHIIESTEDEILNSQRFLQIAERILRTDKRCVMIIDSISSLADEREMAEGVGVQTRGSGAIWVSQFTKQMGNIVPVKNHIVIAVLHIMANTGYGANTFERGGNAIQFQSDIKLRAEGFNAWSLVKDGEQIGQTVDWKCAWSALGPPGKKCTSFIKYGYGIDDIMEDIEDACEVGLIIGEKYYYLEFMKNHLGVLGINEWISKDNETAKEQALRAHGKGQLRDLFINRPELLTILREELKEWR